MKEEVCVRRGTLGVSGRGNTWREKMWRKKNRTKYAKRMGRKRMEEGCEEIRERGIGKESE